MRIILASTSPRRIELMERAGLEFEIIPPETDEKTVTEEFALKFGQDADRKLAEDRAHLKANDVAVRLGLKGHEDFLVIGADTVVSKDGKFYGKPDSKENALNMLRELSGATHTVTTGVEMIDGEDITCTFSVRTFVTFGEFDSVLLNDYVEKHKAYGKAGSYGIQDPELKDFITKIEGDRDNVIGLPVKTLLKHIEENEKWRQWK